MDLISALSSDFSKASIIAFIASIILWGYFAHLKKINIRKNPFYAFAVWTGSIFASYTFIFVVIPTFIYAICEQWVSWAIVDYMLRLYTFIGTFLFFVLTLVGTARMKIE